MKFYSNVFVLAHSRYKYLEWKNRPFTTKDAICCHKNALRFFGGRKDEFVYDQDHLLSVSENVGDLVLTTEFQAYESSKNSVCIYAAKHIPNLKG